MNQRYLLPLLALNLGCASACGGDDDTDTGTDTGSKPATPVGTWDLESSNEGGEAITWPTIDVNEDTGYSIENKDTKVLTLAEGDAATWSRVLTYTYSDCDPECVPRTPEITTWEYEGTWTQESASQTYAIAFDDQATKTNPDGSTEAGNTLKLTLECTLGTGTLSCNDTSSDDTYTFKAASAE